ncbi:hypothetical protein ScPMuIL_015202 [Solemya velum]
MKTFKSDFSSISHGQKRSAYSLNIDQCATKNIAREPGQQILPEKKKPSVIQMLAVGIPLNHTLLNLMSRDQYPSQAELHIRKTGPGISRCLENATWTPVKKRCEADECGYPPQFPGMSAAFPRPMSFGDNVWYRCDDGYTSNGESGLMTCLEGGVFSAMNQTCKLNQH